VERKQTRNFREHHLREKKSIDGKQLNEGKRKNAKQLAYRSNVEEIRSGKADCRSDGHEGDCSARRTT